MEFVEGAAYVSLSRNMVYISSSNGDLWEAEHRVNGTVIRIDPDSRPDDLVMIWKPGDTVIPADNVSTGETTIDHYTPGHPTEQAPELKVAGSNCMEPTHPFTLHICDGPEARRVATPEEELEIRRRKSVPPEPVVRYDDEMNLVFRHPKTRGWFLPTRYHEQPGRYEDEMRQEWHVIPSGVFGGTGIWKLHKWSSRYTSNPYPKGWQPTVPADPGMVHIAVRWIGDLDG